MAQTTFTVDLLSALLPYNFRELGASCVFPDSRETAQRAPQQFQGADAIQQQGYNQAYYMENVMPTSRGYTSVGFQSTVAQYTTLVPEYVLECRGAAGELSYIAIAGSVALKWNTGQFWEPMAGISVADDFIPQTAVVRGTSYFYFGSFILYRFDFVANTLVAVPVPALDMGAIQGITSGGSQLVMYSSDVLYYSAVLNAADFLPSLATGAGSTAVLALKGTIVCALPLGQDFILYTQYSAIHARYTGNLAFPFVYNEIAGSTGIVSQNHVAYNTNTGSHVVYTNAGMMEVTAEGASALFTELADGLVKGILPYIDPLSGTLAYTSTAALSIRLAFIANRWLCISVGDAPESPLYQEAYIFDSSLKRWGRLKVTHTAMFEWAGTASAEGITTYQDLATAYPTYADLAGLLYRDLGNLAAKFSALNKQKIAIMSHLGQVCVLAATENGQGNGNNVGTDAAMPRVFLGRIKMYRNAGCIAQWIRCNKLLTGALVLHGHDYNGAPVRKVSNLKPNTRHAGTYSGNLSADSISIEVQGAFVLTELVLAASNGGTHQQYAAAVKKFDRLFVSNIYTLTGDAEGLMGTQASLEKAYFAPEGDTEVLYTDNPVLLSGTLAMDLYTWPQPYTDEGAQTGNADITAGLLQVVLVLHAQPWTDEGAQTGDASITAGDLQVVLITHSQPYTDEGAQTGDASIQAGSLI